jgi:hypothetical protein
MVVSRVGVDREAGAKAGSLAAMRTFHAMSQTRDTIIFFGNLTDTA